MIKIMEKIENEKTLVGKSVLLVEDDKTNCFLMDKLLKAKGMEITCVSNGADALNALKNNQYDLALIDINLGPNSINGYEIIKEFKETGNDETITIALTAYAMETDKKKIMKSGFDTFFIKPVRFNEFVKFMIRIFTK